MSIPSPPTDVNVIKVGNSNNGIQNIIVSWTYIPQDALYYIVGSIDNLGNVGIYTQTLSNYQSISFDIFETNILTYNVIVVTSIGQSEPSLPSDAVTIVIVPPPTNVNGNLLISADANGQSITISWDMSPDYAVQHYNIQTFDVNMQMCASQQTSQTETTEKSITIIETNNNVYKYCIVAVTSDSYSAQSELSNAITIILIPPPKKCLLFVINIEQYKSICYS